jgi:hypothetical protein
MQSHIVDLQAEMDEVLADDCPFYPSHIYSPINSSTVDDLSESFFLIPSSSSAAGVKPTAPSGPSATTLQTENAALKSELQALQKRLAVQEQVLRSRADADRELRASISLAKQEAQRAIASSSVLLAPPPRGSPPVPMPAPIPVPIPGQDFAIPAPLADPAATKKIKDLEDEIRALKAENEKQVRALVFVSSVNEADRWGQRTMIVRFREKWEKLKENSKKKKASRAAAEADARVGGGVLREKIEEEPEEEERAAAGDVERTPTAEVPPTIDVLT